MLIMFVCTGFSLSSFLGKTFREDPDGLHRTSEASGTAPAGNLTTLKSAFGVSDIATGTDATPVLLLISSGWSPVKRPYNH